MTSGGVSGVANLADLLTGGDFVSFAHENAALVLVQVRGFDASSVVDNDRSGSVRVHAGLGDGACLRSPDRTVTAASVEVDTRVEAVDARHGVGSHAIDTGDGSGCGCGPSSELTSPGVASSPAHT